MQPSYQFGPFRLDTGDRLLFKSGELVPLPPKAMGTLLALVANHGRVVEKDELLKTVWPDTFVEEGGLARNISMLRKALGDAGEDAAYIETIPKRGYRFVGDIAAPPPPPAPPPRRNYRRVAVAISVLVILAIAATVLWRAAESRRTIHAVRSIAVLPLKNLSNDPSQKYLSESMTEVLTDALARVRGLHVIPASAVRGRGDVPLQELVKGLRADAAIEGAVLRSGNRVRVTVQLVDARTGWVLWPAEYNRDFGDVLALEAELAESIAREVNLTVAPPAVPRGSNADAAEAYLRGRYCWNRRTEEGLRQAVSYFGEAVQKDPKYAAAYAGLADSYALLGSNGCDAIPPREAMPQARAAAEKALELDPNLAEAVTTLGYVALAYDWDLKVAEARFRRAVELNPAYPTAHHWYGHYWLAAGRPDKALEEMTRAQKLRPDSLPIMLGVGWANYFAGNYDAAIAQYRKALDMDPNFALGRQTLGLAFERKGMHTEALAELERAVALSGGTPSAVAGLGAAYAASGDRRRAGEQLEKLRAASTRRYVPAIIFASLYLAMNDCPQLAAALRQAVQERSEYVIYVHADPSFRPFLDDPRFSGILPTLKP